MLRVPCCLVAAWTLCASAVAVAAAAPVGRSLVLPETWQVQPAKAPEAPPRDGDWGTIRGDWRRGPTTARGTSWEKASRADLHSLWFEQKVTLPAAWQGRRVFADFRRIEGDAIVFLNGERVAELLRPGGEVELTARALPGQENVLRVFVTRDYTGISRGFEEDPLRLLTRKDLKQARNWPMGITAPVTLTALPRPAGITDVFAVPSWRQKTLTLEIEVDAAQATEDLTLRGTVLDAAGKPALRLASGPLSVPAGRSVQRVTAAWANPIPWELDGPYLYTAQVVLERAGTSLDEAPAITFGFREVWTEGRRLMMNGHPSRWRLGWGPGWNGGASCVSFFRLMGFNVFQIQPHPGAWWGDWSETPLYDDALLTELDRTGSGVTVPAPGVNRLYPKLLTDKRLQADYERETRLWLRRYRNHPSVLAWAVGMNFYCPPSNIHADGMGRRPEKPVGGAPQVIELAREVVRRHDPTRLVYSHAGANTGDLSTSNVYLNFVPLQEREEWPMAWAQSGNMPYSAVEFGQPYTANYWKGKQFLLTEYLAMYFGDRAYREEGEEGLRRTVETGLANKSGHGAGWKDSEYPLYWDFQNLFVRQTDRSWRTWGVNGGWMYWNWGHAYGDPPGYDGKNVFSRYYALKEPVKEKPAWANRNFDIHAQAMQPLLAYLAGAPRHTDKTHAYYGGETIRKQVAVVWDGPGARTLTAEWKLAGADGKPLGTGRATLAVKAGDIAFAPIAAVAPSVKARAELKLSLVVREGARVVATDSLALQVFPRASALALPAGSVVVFDPAGKTAPWLNALGVKAVPWKQGMALPKSGLLIVGREALRAGTRLPYTAADVAAGLRVLVMEQRPEVWEGMGFRALESMPRQVFPRDAGSPVLAGLGETDLAYWRGSPDLLPECRAPRGYGNMRAPKWTNTHALASVVLQIPQAVGFTPLLACEFDLDYSPLLEWRYGRGMVTFCTLDLTGRVGSDPAATLLARNLVHSRLRLVPVATRAVAYAGGPAGKALLERLRVDAVPVSRLGAPAESLLVLGEGETGIEDAMLRRFVAEGGRVLTLPRSAEELARLGLKAAPKSLVRATLPKGPLFRAVGPGLVRWRDPLDVAAFTAEGQPEGAQVVADGVGLLWPQGRGLRVHLQVSPAALETRYAEDADRRLAVRPSVARLRQLVARVLTNLDAAPAAEMAQRLTTVNLGASYEALSPWQVLGPFPVAKEDGRHMIDTVFPGEADAIAGETTNPNTVYTGPDGTRYDWRRTVAADDKGFVDLATPGRETLAVSYVVRKVHSEAARVARLRLGVDYWMQVWVNGKPVYRVVDGHGSPRENRHQVNVPLQAGENVITLKVGAGGKGFGFWANISQAGAEVADSGELRESGPGLYDASLDGPDPYLFHYW